MIVQEHQCVAGWCIWCGAPQKAVNDAAASQTPRTTSTGQVINEPITLTCIKRDDCVPGKLMPEPFRRQLACEDATTIAARMAELQAERDANRSSP